MNTDNRTEDRIWETGVVTAFVAIVVLTAAVIAVVKLLPALQDMLRLPF